VKITLIRMWQNAMSRLLTWINCHRVGTRSIAWSTLSIVAFIIAALLTHHIAYVKEVLGSTDESVTSLVENSYGLSVLATSGTEGPAEVNYDYAARDRKATLMFKLPAGTKKLRLQHLYQLGSCHYWEGPGKIAGPLHDTQDHDTADVDLAGVTVDPHHLIVCSVSAPPPQLNETFTTSVSAFRNLRDSPAVGHQEQLTTMPIKLTINSRDGSFEVVANPFPAEREILIEPDHIAVVRFHSVRKEELRDWYFVLIGAFVAFGAALFLESLRPYIERIGENPTS
jgi:hypothetical protein